MKKFAKVLSLLLAFAIFSSTASFAASVPISQEKMIDICLVSTEDYFVVVSVPESKAAVYQEQLETDQKFFQAELQQAVRSSGYPGYPGRVISETYMYEEDIQQFVDAANGPGTFSEWLSKVGAIITAADILQLIKLSKVQNVILFVAGILNAAASAAQQKQEKWWNDSLIAIMRGHIRAVKHVLIENTTDYPKVWRIFVRVY